MRVLNVGQRKILCRGGEILPGTGLSIDRNEAFRLLYLFAHEVIIEEDERSVQPVIEEKTKKKKKKG